MADRSVLITGGTGGLGGAVTDAFLADGWRVVLPVRDGTTRVDGAEVLPGVDLTDQAAVAAAVKAAASRPAAPLRAVVNLVGGYASGGKVHEVEPDELDRMLQLNLKPGFLLARAAMPRLAEGGGGAYVGVSARAALRPFPGAAAYITAKAGVIAFVQALAVEYRDAGVRANAVLPNAIDTPANREQMPNADFSKWVPPDEIARVIRFLVSDDSKPTSGAAVPVYGRAV